MKVFIIIASLLLLSVTPASSLSTPANTMVQRKVLGVERDIDIPANVFPNEEELKKVEDDNHGSKCERGWFDSTHKGAKLHYRKWAVDKPRAIVINAHGIQSHSGNGIILDDGRKIDASLRAEGFNEKGYSYYGFDYFGHGFSEGKRWLVPDWKVNLADYCTFVNLVARENDPNVPIILLGESYGSCLSIHLARQFQDRPETGPKNFDSVILCASAIEADLPPYPVRFVLKNILAPLFPSWAPFFMPNTVSADRIWRDPKIIELKTAPRRAEMRLDSAGQAFRLGTASNMLDALIALKTDAIPGFMVPFALLHGTDDFALPISGAEHMYETADTPSEDKEFHRLDGLYHAVFADPESHKAMDAAIGWVEKRVKARSQ